MFIKRAAEECVNFEVPVLFSGGVDSLMVALALGDVLFKLANTNGQKFTGKVRLISVAFGENEKVSYFLNFYKIMFRIVPTLPIEHKAL